MSEAMMPEEVRVEVGAAVNEEEHERAERVQRMSSMEMQRCGWEEMKASPNIREALWMFISDAFPTVNLAPSENERADQFVMGGQSKARELMDLLGLTFGTDNFDLVSAQEFKNDAVDREQRRRGGI